MKLQRIMGVRWKRSIKSHSIRSTSLTVGSVGRPNPIAKALDLNALGDVQGIPLLWVDIEEKPWRKPGADISEYFNYGFNEDTWKAYCGKQRRIRGGWENLSASSRMKVQRGRTDPANKEFLFDRPSLCSVYQPDLRRWSGAIDVIGGQTATLSRQEGRRRNRGNAKQVLSEASRDSSANKMISFLRPNIPPPPLPPPLPNVSSGAQLLLLQHDVIHQAEKVKPLFCLPCCLWVSLASSSRVLFHGQIHSWTLQGPSSYSPLLLLLRQMSFETCEHGILDRND
ncbi:unnamed protein product [Boreogadus saida]